MEDRRLRVRRRYPILLSNASGGGGDDDDDDREPCPYTA